MGKYFRPFYKDKEEYMKQNIKNLSEIDNI